MELSEYWKKMNSMEQKFIECFNSSSETADDLSCEEILIITWQVEYKLN